MHVCLILFPGFQMLAYVLAREVLRVANKCAGQDLFTWETRSVTGDSVKASDGTMVATGPINWHGETGFDLILLCAGYDPLHHLPMGLRAFLARADKAGATLGGLDTGSMVMAKLGLLNGREAVLHHEAEPGFREQFPDIAISDRIYAFDRQRLTTAGGVATADAMLAWIGRVHSTALAAKTADALAHGRIRDTGEGQRLPKTADPLLDQMQGIMATHLEDPLSLDRVAAELGLSQKQLRLRCRKGLNQTPAQIYLGLRLDRAAQLVKDTELSVLDVATATGFASPSSFTRSYKARFGSSPRMQRRPPPEESPPGLEEGTPDQALTRV
jgi:AraC family carnitine catabolism transcriptional activator